LLGPENRDGLVEPSVGVEPTTYALPWRCSTY
jgi:hypothetical protein